ncbi:PREDICTED: PDZ domain-containing protein 9, partial [Crocodylus porosus]|uniref:PDZ domain-containing protein 9 n=1 Tax=Crocodylus porosus TaxID=8502 RepID=UPI0009394E67
LLPLAGDILIKIGHANVLGWTLRELRQLLYNIPVGTSLQIKVYRDFVEVPEHWQSAVELIPEVKLPSKTKTEITLLYFIKCFFALFTIHILQHYKFHIKSYLIEITDWAVLCNNIHYVVHFSTSSKSSEEKEVWSSSDDEVDIDLERFRYKSSQSYGYEFLEQLPSISRVWHEFKRNHHTFTVGTDIGCDIILHNDVEALCDSGFATTGIKSPSYWTMPKNDDNLSSSSSSLSDAFWLEEFAIVLN